MQPDGLAQRNRFRQSKIEEISRAPMMGGGFLTRPWHAICD
jgi:hypothetical protein